MQKKKKMGGGGGGGAGAGTDFVSERTCPEKTPKSE